MKTKAIVYFHGFNGENSNKYDELSKHYFEYDVIKFKYSFNYKNDISYLRDFQGNYKKIFFIGSSLGCLSAAVYGHTFEIFHILINPSFFPEKTLKDELSEEKKEFYIELRKKYPKNKNAYLRYGIFSTDDERLNHQDFLDSYDILDLNIYRINNQGHKVKRFDEVISIIDGIKFPSHESITEFFQF